MGAADLGADAGEVKAGGGELGEDAFAGSRVFRLGRWMGLGRDFGRDERVPKFG